LRRNLRYIKRGRDINEKGIIMKINNNNNFQLHHHHPKRRRKRRSKGPVDENKFILLFSCQKLKMRKEGI